jgi:hypothetical protein
MTATLEVSEEVGDLKIYKAVAPLMEKLSWMENAAEIAEHLTREGIKAVRNDPRSCAVARYLQMNTGYTATVVSDSVAVHSRTGRCALMENSSVVKDFIKNFDDGMYPDLEMRDDNIEQ